MWVVLAGPHPVGPQAETLQTPLCFGMMWESRVSESEGAHSGSMVCNESGAARLAT